jgi:hypothetical protein
MLWNRKANRLLVIPAESGNPGPKSEWFPWTPAAAGVTIQ